MPIYCRTAKAYQTWPNMILLTEEVHVSGGEASAGLRFDDTGQG